MVDINKIRIVQDFPKEGIKFFDITTILNDAATFKEYFDELLKMAKEMRPDAIVALEARGFLFAPALALALNIPFAPIRKEGKLPYSTYRESYDLEYGSETIEMHTDALKPNQRVLIFDDVLATGGTGEAAVNLVRHFSPSHISALFLMDLAALNGKEKLKVDEIRSLLTV
ncbi:MAG: adenine phosphoribosyltransferase [Bacteroidales bacterium]|nr:adenine phosphoribosyltransferase [Bacteroidales bacterium]